ncbi:zinc-ribbon domain-containing protein [Candidatus Pelagibacter sp.]|nr:zinc-ribbon domain-containing protein [Candidatus Pelagibacter sp.]
MIIECVNCDKKFNVNSNLIPDEGREIKCGSCNHTWHFNKEGFLENITPIVNNIDEQEHKNNIKIEEVVQENDTKIVEQITITKNKQIPKVTTTNNSKNFKKNSNSIKKINNIKIDKFFSYLLVFIISFVALIILLDTIKSPLINFFPGLEFLLFNLFETLKDIKSFIIDLT